MSRHWVLAKLGLVALYGMYIACAVPDLHVVVVALVVPGLAALACLIPRAPLDAARVRSATAAATLVLASLHARALPLPAPLQLALAAAVAGSSVTTLLLPRTHGHVLATWLLTLLTALGVGLSGAVDPDAITLVLALAALAAFRPLGALGAAFQAAGMHSVPADPALFWDAVPRAASTASTPVTQEAPPCP